LFLIIHGTLGGRLNAGSDSVFDGVVYDADITAKLLFFLFFLVFFPFLCFTLLTRPINFTRSSYITNRNNWDGRAFSKKNCEMKMENKQKKIAAVE